MKKILIGIFILSSTTLFAQDHRDNNAPTNIQHSFQQDYPNAQSTQWNNSNGQWHGTFKDQNNRNVETHYNADGQRIDTHISYNQNELPSSVKDRANKKYNTNYISTRIERPNSHSTILPDKIRKWQYNIYG